MTIGNIPRCPPSVCGQPNKVTVSGCMCACAHVCVRELVAHDVCVRKCVCVCVCQWWALDRPCQCVYEYFVPRHTRS